MKRFTAVLLLSIGLLLVSSTGALAKGEPQGPHRQGWFCVLDLDTWHCVPPGVFQNLGGPSGPSLNWHCDDPNDALCAEQNWGAFNFGPPPGTHFVGTENLIRVDLVPNPGSRPCPGTSGVVELPFGAYFYCHHYQE